jgi:hypothetical protein
MTGRTPGSCCCHLEKAEFEEPVWRDGSGRVHCCAMPTWRPFARCCWRNISVGWTHSRSGRRSCNGEATDQPDDRATSGAAEQRRQQDEREKAEHATVLQVGANARRGRGPHHLGDALSNNRLKPDQECYSNTH